MMLLKCYIATEVLELVCYDVAMLLANLETKMTRSRSM